MPYTPSLVESMTLANAKQLRCSYRHKITRNLLTSEENLAHFSSLIYKYLEFNCLTSANAIPSIKRNVMALLCFLICCFLDMFEDSRATNCCSPS